MALNAETITNCVRNYLAGGRKKLNKALNEEMSSLLKWATKAGIGECLIKEKYTVVVLDPDLLKEDAENNLY